MDKPRRKTKPLQGIAILLLGGKGERYGSDIPKQYVAMAGKPLFLFAYETFSKSEDIDAILLVIPKGYKDKTLKLVGDKNKLIAIIEGGPSREESAYRAVSYLGKHHADPYAFVFIHDADRPLVSENLIHKLKEAAKKNLASIPVLPIADSMCYSPNGEAVDHYGDRRGNYTVQTPQVAALSLYLSAFNKAKDHLGDFTDDASLLMSTIGTKPAMVRGEPTNIKVNDRDGQLLFETLYRGLKG